MRGGGGWGGGGGGESQGEGDTAEVDRLRVVAIKF